jgi:RNA polymerase sigma factor FliA
MDTQQLVVENLALAATIAGNMSKRLPCHLDPQDLHQDARLGLLSAAARYDARKNVPFGSYARRRIGGAVVDGLRQNDHLSRCARARIKARGSEAPPEPLPAIAPDQIPGALEPPDRYAAAAECHRLLNAAIETLPERLQTVLRAYYYAGQTMRAIGGNLGISEGRVSQIHARALRLLRGHFELRGFTSSTDFTVQSGASEVRL